jgi:hypothetical protein
MKVSLISFASKSWENAAARFLSQAQSTGLFSNIKIFTESTLDRDTNFFLENKEFISRHPAGFGGWIWKPYILNWAMLNLTDSDFVMYLDIGSEFNINKQTASRFFEYISIAGKDNVFAFRNRDLEQNLTHCSVIENIYPEAKGSRQFEANSLIFKNNKKSSDIISDWLHSCINNDYFNIDPKDRYSCCEYWGGTHLHDQSILSCILKKNKIEGVSDEASWYLPGYSVYGSINQNRQKYPLFTARNPFKHSIINEDCISYKEFSTCMHKDTEEACKSLVIVR